MDIDIDYTMVGARIKELRQLAHITQAAFAELVDVSPSYVSLIETGKKHPSLEFFIRTAAVLETTLDYLLTGTLPPSDKQKVSPVLLHMFKDCSDADRNMLIELLQNTKGIMKKYGRIASQ